jgi:effector-binding domain-containing protein
MSSTPQLVERNPQKYIASRIKTDREKIGEVVPELYVELAALAARNNIAISGAPIIRYFSIDYSTGTVDIDAGFPISNDEAPAHERIKTGELPGGTYAMLLHVGLYDSLYETTAQLLAWGREQGMNWPSQHNTPLSTWTGRVEHYLVGPTDAQNPKDWKTEVAILVE